MEWTSELSVWSEWVSKVYGVNEWVKCMEWMSELSVWSEGVSDCCLISPHLECDFVLDQHAELDFYSVSSLKQQSEDRHVAPLGHIILIQRKLVFVSTAAFLLAYQSFRNCKWFFSP
jgi:hypothetical protein